MENNEYITLKEGTVKLSLNRFTNAIVEKCMHLNMDLYTAFEKCYSHYENKNWEAEPPLEEWKEDIMCFKKEWESIEK